MPDNKGYNGWKNYETWAVALWINNEQSSYEYWHGVAETFLEGCEGDKKEAAIQLANALHDGIEEAMPEVQGVWADLLGAAFSEVDWYEIAVNMLSDIGGKGRN